MPGPSVLIGGRDPFATTTGDPVPLLKTGRIAPFVRNGEVRQYGFRRPHAREDVAAGDAALVVSCIAKEVSCDSMAYAVSGQRYSCRNPGDERDRERGMGWNLDRSVFPNCAVRLLSDMALTKRSIAAALRVRHESM